MLGSNQNATSFVPARDSGFEKLQFGFDKVVAFRRYVVRPAHIANADPIIMNVFISSVAPGFEMYRDAAASAVRSLGHVVMRAEDFGVSPDSPLRPRLAGVHAADVVVLLLGGACGAEAEGGRSATYDEYLQARERCALFAFVQGGVERDAAQQAFVAEIQEWACGHYAGSFDTPESLREKVRRALREFERAQTTAPESLDDLLGRALAVLPEDRQGRAGDARLGLAVTAGPRRSVLHPADLEDDGFRERVHRQAVFEQHRVLTAGAHTDTRIDGDTLVLEQAHAWVSLDEEGTVAISMRLEPAPERTPVIMEERVREQLARGLRYVHALLEEIDPFHRLSHCAIAASVLGGTYLQWRTEDEHARRANQAPTPPSTMDGHTAQPVHLTPPHRPRAALGMQRDGIVDELIALLRRRFR